MVGTTIESYIFKVAATPEVLTAASSLATKEPDIIENRYSLNGSGLNVSMTRVEPRKKQYPKASYIAVTQDDRRLHGN